MGYRGPAGVVCAGELAPSWQVHTGALIVGWGTFNLLDTLNHVLGFHHVRDDIGGPIAWDIGFFVFALALIAAGYALMRRAPATGRPPAQTLSKLGVYDADRG